MEVINFESMLNSLQKLIFHLTEDNMENSVQQTLNLFDPNFPYSFNFTICKIVYSAFCKQNNEIYKFINYLKLIQTKEEEMDKSIPKIIDIFIDQIIKIKSHDAYFIIEKMIEKNLIDKNVTKNISSPYFAHYKTEDKNKIKKYFYSHYRKNFEELSRNNWELHKKYVKEGVNENEIAKIIRYDEIEKLQEISSQTNFDFNQRITPSPYERCSFINQYYVTLIEYAAFFGSVKCFKYLLMNNVNVENTGKYAVASGNEEIIHLCEQNHSSFKDAYETAIKFHQNDIFRYIFENKLQKFYDVYDDVEGRQIIQTRDLIELGWICINFSNYEILSFLLKEGMKIYNKNINLINESAQIGNIFLIKYFLIKNQLPKDILVYSAESGNIELFKYIFEQDGIDINVKNYYNWTALMKASQNGNLEIVKLLLKQEKIDINCKTGYGTALILAIENNYNEISKLLLEKEGIDVNIKASRGGMTALMSAIKNENIEIVKLLLSKDGINFNAKSDFSLINFRVTPLMVAAENGSSEIVEILLKQKGIDINAKNYIGRTALMLASKKGHIETVKLLLEQEEIDINAKDKDGRTALILASVYDYKKIVELLLEQKGIDIDVKDNYRNTALLLADRLHHNEIAKLIRRQKFYRAFRKAIGIGLIALALTYFLFLNK